VHDAIRGPFSAPKTKKIPGRLTGGFFVFWGGKWRTKGVMRGGGMNVSVWRTVSENIWKKISYMT
jgi:hypothetical protein